MDAEVQALLRELLLTQRVASLGTLRRGREFDEPALSMVPFAWLPGTAEVVLHVSALAQHTRFMAEHPRTSLMIVAPLREGDNPLALPRATLQCDASRLEPGTPQHAAAAAAYRARFPQAEQTFAAGAMLAAAALLALPALRRPLSS
jgi:putative heme iron utilization protein